MPLDAKSGQRVAGYQNAGSWCPIVYGLADADRDVVGVVLEVEDPGARVPQVGALSHLEEEQRLADGSFDVVVAADIGLPGHQTAPLHGRRGEVEVDPRRPELPRVGAEGLVGSGRRHHQGPDSVLLW